MAQKTAPAVPMQKNASRSGKIVYQAGAIICSFSAARGVTGRFLSMTGPFSGTAEANVCVPADHGTTSAAGPLNRHLQRFSRNEEDPSGRRGATPEKRTCFDYAARRDWGIMLNHAIGGMCCVQTHQSV